MSEDDDRSVSDGPWQDAWTEADERRYQQRRAEERAAARRRRRQAAVFALLVLLVVGAGTTAAGVYQGWWQWPPWSGRSEPEPVRTVVLCPTPEITAAPVAEVVLTVLNSTSRTGLAAETAAALTERGFTVGAIGNDPGDPVSGTAVVRHGPQGLAAATTVAAHVPDAQLVDDGREGTAVELSLGEAFAGLRAPEEAAPLMEPQAAPSPPGCVPPEPQQPQPEQPQEQQPDPGQPQPTG